MHINTCTLTHGLKLERLINFLAGKRDVGCGKVEKD